MAEPAVLALTGRLEDPGAARQLVERCLAEVGPDVCANATLLVSELVTNVVRHGELPAHLAIDVDADRVRVSVYDSGPELPPRVPRGAAPDSGTGRGLIIVDALARSWGVRIEPARPGKDVWFELALADMV